jgi:hypothetical protein
MSRGATLKVMAIPDFTITPRGAAIATFGAARPVRRQLLWAQSLIAAGDIGKSRAV